MPEIVETKNLTKNETPAFVPPVEKPKKIIVNKPIELKIESMTEKGEILISFNQLVAVPDNLSTVRKFLKFEFKAAERDEDGNGIQSDLSDYYSFDYEMLKMTPSDMEV